MHHCSFPYLSLQFRVLFYQYNYIPEKEKLNEQEPNTVQTFLYFSHLQDILENLVDPSNTCHSSLLDP